MPRAIIIMAKVPRPGTVKTRLEGVISSEACAELATAFLKDTVEKALRVCENTIIAFFPPTEKAAMTEVAPEHVRLFAQIGETLDERIVSAFQFAFSEGADSAVMIGTDSPTFPADHIEQAFEFLELETDVVLGKTTDGGFYLIGLRGLDARVFNNVRWSTSRTFEDVYRNVMARGLHLREVPSWYDVDEPKDLEELFNELRHNANALRRAPETARILRV
ncbi:MAG: TIGR04282 family arsenosugar biosynthesis glycosyltransferase [Acidobacteria bacterium]|nr:TIGR04282 family arsenosugar biosynthesis glycosyltransferase [Acidobacteriota bacterium]MBK8149688.1 TIGR04282 family arsenosugar biosynthesis glycosyltransferase [Acidobacteriota bacterium]MBK8809813.1 TIGR04282 family arsenosugar biosynthesis glycosyltransferase [Acidobacteriota bacterium]